MGLAEPVTVTKDADYALRVMFLVSSAERGTELAFEMHDPPRLAAAKAGHADYEWHTQMQVQLLDSSGVPAPRSPGDSFGLGQHEFGFLRQELFFEQLSPDTRRVRLEIRGALGDWDIPLEVLPLGDTGIAAKMPDHAEETRHGITVRLRGVVATHAETVLDIEAVAAPPARSTLAIGAWPTRYKPEDLLGLIDERGDRLDEIIPAQRRHNWGQGGRTVATFPALPNDSSDFTLRVPAVQIAESESGLDITLPVHAPTDVLFGRCPMTIRWADVVEDLRQAPGEAPTRGIEVHLKLGGRDDERRVLRPSRVNVDGVRNWGYGLGYANPEGPVLSVRLPAGASAKTVTLLDPIVEVRGPWEIQWRK